jgi:hypothetical protein
MFNEGRLKSFHKPCFLTQPGPSLRPNPKIVVEGGQECEVGEILDKRWGAKGKEHLVRWKDYGPEDNSWEPRANLQNAREAVHDFEAQGWASREAGYHVMNSCSDSQTINPYDPLLAPTSEPARYTILRKSLTPNPLHPTMSPMNLTLLNCHPAHQSGADAEDHHQSGTDANQVPINVVRHDRSTVTGVLCRWVIALIWWRQGYSPEIDATVMASLDHWLHTRGLSIYIDLVL